MNKVSDVLENVSAPKVMMPEIICNNSSYLLFFLPQDAALYTGLKEIKTKLEMLSIDTKMRYFPCYAHIVFMRYIRPLAATNHQLLKAVDRIDYENLLL